jgi:hypothetical protein
MSLRCKGTNRLAKSIFRNKESLQKTHLQNLLETQNKEVYIPVDQDDWSSPHNFTVCSGHAVRACETFTSSCSDVDPCVLCFGFGVMVSNETLVVQSTDMQDCCEAEEDLQQENVRFGDSVAGLNVGMPAPISYGNMDKAANTSLKEYLSRPVEIATITWTEGANLDTDINPWTEYFSKAAIKRKLDNYSLLRCNLHIKVVINASPFYYGLGLVSYRPLTLFAPAPVFAGVGLEDFEFMGKSQRPHIWLRPENNEGGEMILPFLYHRQYIRCVSATNFDNMGTLSFDSLSLLNNANSVSGMGCTIQVYAWAENVELAGPTLDLAVQSKDEYEDDGAISAPASAIASIANKVVTAIDSVPIIGSAVGVTIRPFAVATEIAATAVGSIARLFGFTNVPVIDDIHAMKSAAFPMLSTTSIGTPIEKLTLDPKNELTIDSKVLGVDVGDELMVKNIVSKPSYLDQFTWQASDNPDTLLWTSAVTPFLVNSTTISSQNYIQGTPMWFVAKAFTYWRGDIIFTFKIISSQYHRGRLRISWDPYSNIGSTADNTAEIYQIIVDIAKDKDVRIRVPWAQSTPYAEINTSSASKLWDTSPITNDVNKYNGTLTVRVLTEQTSPVSSADVKIAVLAEGAENMRFMGPRDLDEHEILTPYAVQSKDESSTLSEYTFGGRKSDTDEHLDLVYGGETIYSLRTLMRRASFHRMMFHSTGSTKVFYEYSYMNRRPLYPGYDPDGIVVADETIGASTANFNFVHWAYVSWFTLPFVGSRGSIIWHVNAESHEVSGSCKIQRSTKVLTTAAYDRTIGTTLANDDGYQSVFFGSVSNAGCSGVSLTNQHTQAGLSVLAPMYSKYKMQNNSADYRTLGTGFDDTDHDTLQVVVNRYEKDSNLSVQSFYCAAGTDYNPIFFLNVPGLYRLGAWPTVPP